MLLMDIEKHVEPLSEEDKEQLMWDVWRMLSEAADPDASKGAEKYFTPGEPVGDYAPVITPKIAKDLESLL